MGCSTEDEAERKEGTDSLRRFDLDAPVKSLSTSVVSELGADFQSADMSSATQQDRLLHRKTATNTPNTSLFSAAPLSARDQDSRLDKRDDDFATAQASSKATSLLDKVGSAPLRRSCSAAELDAPVPTWS